MARPMTVYDSADAVRQTQYADHMAHTIGDDPEAPDALRIITNQYLRAIAVGVVAVAAALEARS